MLKQSAGNSISQVATQLLLNAGIIDNATAESALDMAQKQGLPVGRILVSAGHLAECDLTSALQAAKLVNSDRLMQPHAVRLLQQAYAECLPLETILERHAPSGSKVGELFLAAQLVTRDDLSRFEEQAQESGITLGRILVMTGTCSTFVLSNALEALHLVRDRSISIYEAARALRGAASMEIGVRKTLGCICGPLPEHKAKLGELLTAAEVLSEIDSLSAVEIGLENNKPVGQVLFERGQLPPTLLKAALRLQSMTDNGALTATQAQILLSRVRELKLPVEQVLIELIELKKETIEFLKHAELVSDKDITKARIAHPRYAQDVPRALVANGLLSVNTLRAAVRLYVLTKKNRLSDEDAVNALVQCDETGMVVEDALKQLAWRARRKESIMDTTHRLRALPDTMVLTA